MCRYFPVGLFVSVVIAAHFSGVSDVFSPKTVMAKHLLRRRRSELFAQKIAKIRRVFGSPMAYSFRKYPPPCCRRKAPALPPQRDTLYLLSTERRHAIGTLNGLAVEGDWVWRFRDWLDRCRMSRCQAVGSRDTLQASPR
jgi:hypothetical protein